MTLELTMELYHQLNNVFGDALGYCESCSINDMFVT